MPTFTQVQIHLSVSFVLLVQRMSVLHVHESPFRNNIPKNEFFQNSSWWVGVNIIYRMGRGGGAGKDLRE